MRLFLFLMISTIGGLVGWHYYNTLNPRKIDYVFESAVVTDITEAVAVTGYAEPIEVRNVQSEIPGIVSQVLVDFNDSVREGQVLARLSADLQDIQYRQAEASWEAARGQVALMKADVSSAEAGVRAAAALLSAAERERDRLKSLVSSQTFERAKLDIAEDSVIRAQAGLSDANSKLTKAKAAMELAEKQVKVAEVAKELAELGAKKTELRSSMNGIVLNKNIKVGDAVGRPQVNLMDDGGGGLFVIAAPLDKMYAIVKVSEADYSRVAVGQSARFTVDAYPSVEFTATVKQIRQGPNSDRTAVSYTTVLEFDNRRDPKTHEWMVKPRSTVSADIEIRRLSQVLAVPNQALLFTPKSFDLKLPELKENQGVVWKTGEDGKPIPIIIERGITDGKYTQVVSGDVKAGEPLIVAEPASESKTGFSPLPIGN